MKILVIIYVLFFMGTTLTFSQTNADFAYISYSALPVADFDKRGGNASLTNLEANLITPTILPFDKLKINNIINYRYSLYRYDKLVNDLMPSPESLQEFRYTLLLRYQLTAKWVLLSVPRLSMRSDFVEDFSDKDLFPSLTIVAIKNSAKMEGLKWGFGLNYNNDLLKNAILPVLFLEYVKPSCRINAFLPNSASFSFSFRKKVEYGLGFISDAAIYHISSSTSGNQYVEYLRTLNVFINPTFSYNFVGRLWLNIKAGIVVGRLYDFYNADFESTSDDYKNSLKSTPFAQIGISIRQ